MERALAFPFDVVLKEEDICNLQKEKAQLKSMVMQGRRVLLYGRRNTGKTSLVESVAIPAFERHFKNHFVLSADLMGVKDLEDISWRLSRAFELGFSRSFPTKAKFQDMLDAIRGIQPQVGVDQFGNWSLSIGGWKASEKKPFMDEVFRQIKSIESTGASVLIVLDEFQDVYFVRQAEALIRNELQRLSAKTSVIILGSKKHILSKIFSAAKSPFFNWGEPIEIQPIEYEIYREYMNERFAQKKVSIDLPNAIYLQDRMNRIPEPINLLCAKILEDTGGNRKVEKGEIERGLRDLIMARKSKMEEYFSRFTESEQEVMIAFAKLGKIQHPSGTEFTRQLRSSKAAISKIVRKFLDEAILYKTEVAYELADPLLAQHLSFFR